MATKEVSTWDGLVAAISSFANGDIIKLTADIDLNREYPMGVASCNITQSNAGTYTLTIDGNGHTIRNLSTSIADPHSIFIKNSDAFTLELIVQNIDFVNLMLSGASLIYVQGSDGDSIACNDCRFVGSRNGSSYLMYKNRNVVLNRCYFNIPWQGLSSSARQYISLIPPQIAATTTYANYCWFHEHYTGWNMPEYWDWDSTYSDANSVFFTFSFMKISGCYIDGDAVATRVGISSTPTDATIKFITTSNANSYTAASQNVVDCSVNFINLTPNYTSVRIGNLGGIYKEDVLFGGQQPTSSVTYSNGTQYNGCSTTAPFPIKATPEQMKDATWLSTNGFAIIVPPSQ